MAITEQVGTCPQSSEVEPIRAVSQSRATVTFAEEALQQSRDRRRHRTLTNRLQTMNETMQTLIEDRDGLHSELEVLSRAVSESESALITDLQQKYRRLGELYNTLNVEELMRRPVVIHQNTTPASATSSNTTDTFTTPAYVQSESSRVAAARLGPPQANQMLRRVRIDGNLRQLVSSDDEPPGAIGALFDPRLGSVNLIGVTEGVYQPRRPADLDSMAIKTRSGQDIIERLDTVGELPSNETENEASNPAESTEAFQGGQTSLSRDRSRTRLGKMKERLSGAFKERK